jgi:hypothetical protein
MTQKAGRPQTDFWCPDWSTEGRKRCQSSKDSTTFIGSRNYRGGLPGLCTAQGAILRVLVTPRSGLDDVAWFSGAEGGSRVDSNNSSECVW